MLNEPIVVKPVKKVVDTYHVESYTEEGVFYWVEVYNDGELTCSCPAITECKHIKDIKKKIKNEQKSTS
ncbi:MAG: hypothetical protein ACOC5T_07500 [Elusimicrobiota bacterium]